jgi:hypothetical protein
MGSKKKHGAKKMYVVLDRKNKTTKAYLFMFYDETKKYCWGYIRQFALSKTNLLAINKAKRFIDGKLKVRVHKYFNLRGCQKEIFSFTDWYIEPFGKQLSKIDFVQIYRQDQKLKHLYL